MKRFALALLLLGSGGQEEKRTLHSFRRITLSEKFTCEGATAGDFNRDGKMDIAAGPWWYEGPEFAKKHELYPPKEFDPLGYSDNFFGFVRDFNGDGWDDLLVVGFPGKDASWFENPAGREERWKRHVALPSLDNEAPWFTDITGDGKPELVGQVGGAFGYAEIDPAKEWTFRAISPKGNRGAFTHGLGVGDVNGDGKADLLEATGWWEQKDGAWEQHKAAFGSGGAQMFAYDVNGDGRNDVITSLAAHGLGLAWFEQNKDGTFTRHLVMGSRPEENRYGVMFGELHALELVDMDGDGLKDIVTGKRWWSHGPKGDVDGGPAVAYWFRLVRDANGVDFVPHRLDDGSGVGTQVVVADVNGDKVPDLVIGNKKGAFVLVHETKQVAIAEWTAAQPKRMQERAVRPTVNVDLETGTLKDWTATGTAFDKQPIKGDTVNARRGDMRSDHAGQFWVGSYEIAGDAPQGTLTSAPFKVTHPWASLLVAGGSHENTRVEVVRADTKKTVFKISGDDSEGLKPAVIDLKEHLGKEIFIRLVDLESGGWGHVNYDDFKFWAERPKFANERKGGDGLPPRDTVKFAGLSPADAAKAMTVPEGFSVSVVAAEPDLHQPVALAIDDRGRVWVAEAFTYPNRQPEGKGRDDIVIFEDADGDGKAEKRTVFATGLNLVSGLELGFGGVWVGAAPYLLFIPDRNGDDKPDGEPEVVLDGWGFQDTHETLNAFTWGPDGWLYGCHGVFTHSLVGKPGTTKEQRVPINAGVWRYHPTRKVFEVFAHGTSNPWGIDFDDTGEAFITACVIPHLYHIVPGGRYIRQAGAHFNRFTYAELDTNGDHVHYAGDRGPHAGNNRSDAAGGGHAHCGAMIYLGEGWPAEYRNRLLMGNVHGNRINSDILERRGSTYVGRHGPDVLLANDTWFRMINMKTGPDGSIFFIDWYDKVPCHTTDPRANDRTNGRLYRMAYRAPKSASIDLAKKSDAELVELQLAKNDYHVRHARRLLQERGAKVAPALEKILKESKDVTRRLRALWALHATTGVGEEWLRDGDELVRAWAVRLRMEAGESSTELARLAKEDASPVVRRELASGLQRLDVGKRWEIVEALCGKMQDDRTVLLLTWYGAEPLAAIDASRAMKLDPLFAFMVRRVAAAGGLDAILPLLRDDARAVTLLQALQEALKGQRKTDMPAAWPEAVARLAKSGRAEVRNLVAALSIKFGFKGETATKLLVDMVRSTAPIDQRLAALDAIIEAKDPEAPALLQSLLSDAGLKLRALRGLAAFDDAKTAPAILGVYASLSPDERRAALSTLSSRTAFARELMVALRAKRVELKDFGADIVRQLRSLGDAEVDKAVAELWGSARSTPEEKQREIAMLKEMLASRKGDVVAGRALFARTCMQCHALFGMGGNLGPDMTGSNRGDLDYLLENIVDPNALIPNEYRATQVTTKDGQSILAIISAQDEKTVTLRTAAETITVAREDIREMKAGGLSIMPEDQFKGLDGDEIASLVAYLRSPTQTAMLADANTIHRFFNGKDLSMWEGDTKLWSVESGELVGKSPGLPRNAFLVSHLEVRDFRLTFEVKLAPDEQNSGLQFRSAVTAEGMKGPQADIGKGWWGKLYEEEGRGLLWEKSAPEVKAGDWNLYEVVAVGSRVKTAINGKLCVDLDDAKLSRRGAIGLQLHAGGALEVRFRKMKLEVVTEAELKTTK